MRIVRWCAVPCAARVAREVCGGQHVRLLSRQGHGWGTSWTRLQVVLRALCRSLREAERLAEQPACCHVIV